MLKRLFNLAKTWWTEAAFESVGFIAAAGVLKLFGYKTFAVAAFTIFCYINARTIYKWIHRGINELINKEF
jgi:hypothetical protein